jgi:nicotinate phosphoribosyltransferase
MTIFNHQRLTNAKIKLDVEGLRRGLYTDKYFENVVRIMQSLREAGYTFAGRSPRTVPVDVSQVKVSELIVEAQIFNRRAPAALVAGVDVALAMLRHVAGYYQGEQFVERWQSLDVTAVEDGVLTQYAGDPESVQPVIEIRGRYSDFAMLETTTLGVLTRASRVATNVYNVLRVSSGKPVLFFPARFDLPEVQFIDGYAYWIAVQRYNMETGRQMTPFVSTDAQAAWWDGRGGGTVPHALIACFLADTAESMVAFARYLPVSVPRIALVDFNNDSAGASVATVSALWEHYRKALEAGDADEQRRWTLNGVRLDTAGNMRDVSLGPDDPRGVSVPLVRKVREALDHAWERWNVPDRLADAAKTYCQKVQIVVSGGFNREKIEAFEREGVPVDVYAVGSHFFQNDREANTDYTMDVVRVKIANQWVPMAKTGRRAGDNPDLHPVDLSGL